MSEFHLVLAQVGGSEGSSAETPFDAAKLYKVTIEELES